MGTLGPNQQHGVAEAWLLQSDHPERFSLLGNLPDDHVYRGFLWCRNVPDVYRYDDNPALSVKVCNSGWQGASSPPIAEGLSVDAALDEKAVWFIFCLWDQVTMFVDELSRRLNVDHTFLFCCSERCVR